ncbi:MAG: hypothetical protein HGA85_08730, partial [Nanoarchaeota archaeon]|nr:hypothetical protein [Nanoarchaeota archaeon]
MDGQRIGSIEQAIDACKIPEIYIAPSMRLAYETAETVSAYLDNAVKGGDRAPWTPIPGLTLWSSQLNAFPGE